MISKNVSTEEHTFQMIDIQQILNLSTHFLDDSMQWTLNLRSMHIS